MSWKALQVRLLDDPPMIRWGINTLKSLNLGWGKWIQIFDCIRVLQMNASDSRSDTGHCCVPWIQMVTRRQEVERSRLQSWTSCRDGWISDRWRCLPWCHRLPPHQLMSACMQTLQCTGYWGCGGGGELRMSDGYHDIISSAYMCRPCEFWGTQLWHHMFICNCSWWQPFWAYGCNELRFRIDYIGIYRHGHGDGKESWPPNI